MSLKGKKYPFRSAGFADWFVEFKRCSKFVVVVVIKAGLHEQENLLSYAFKKFWFWQNCPYVAYVRPPVHESRGEILHFKGPRVSAVNCMATWTFREKKIEQQQSRFREKELNAEREIKKKTKKTKETNFIGRKTWKFYSSGEKMRTSVLYKTCN